MILNEAMIEIQRLYDMKHEGFRILVDRLWPRGISKDKLAVDLWLKEISPTDELRKWFSHDPTKWDEFKRKYIVELSTPELKIKLNEIKTLEREEGTIILLYGARDEKYNQAVVLKEVLDSM